jgi:hypothetical protein
MGTKSSSVGRLVVLLGMVVSLASCGLARSCGNYHFFQKTAAAARVPGPNEILSCDGVSSADASKAHSVKLSWIAPVPKSGSWQDAVNGYYVYRSVTSHTYEESGRLNSSPLAATHCVDASVVPQGIYYYAVKSVAKNGVVSEFSGEIKAVIPGP